MEAFISDASLRSMARDIGLSDNDLTLLGETVMQTSHREVIISFGVIDYPQDPALYTVSLLPSGELEVVIDVPSLDALKTGLAQEHPEISLVGVYVGLLESASYATLQEDQVIYTPLGPNFAPLRDAFLRKHQWRVIRPES